MKEPTQFRKGRKKISSAILIARRSPQFFVFLFNYERALRTRLEQSQIKYGVRNNEETSSECAVLYFAFVVCETE